MRSRRISSSELERRSTNSSSNSCGWKRNLHAQRGHKTTTCSGTDAGQGTDCDPAPRGRAPVLKRDRPEEGGNDCRGVEQVPASRGELTDRLLLALECSKRLLIRKPESRVVGVRRSRLQLRTLDSSRGLARCADADPGRRRHRQASRGARPRSCCHGRTSAASDCFAARNSVGLEPVSLRKRVAK
jgi:hypothetical protein